MLRGKRRKQYPARQVLDPWRDLPVNCREVLPCGNMGVSLRDEIDVISPSDAGAEPADVSILPTNV